MKESDVININFENFKRGYKFEKEVILVFCNLFNSEIEICGFFEDLSDFNYGVSLDVLVVFFLILEVKIRLVKIEGLFLLLK